MSATRLAAAIACCFFICFRPCRAAQGEPESQPPGSALIVIESETDKAPEFRIFDGFDGKLSLVWQPLRPDPSHFSLESHPGRLTITTQRGTIYQDRAPLAKNIFLLDNPFPKASHFAVTNCLEAFQPKQRWQQAGLILYSDDDNYLKWVCQPDIDGNPQWTLLRETNAIAIQTKYSVEAPLDGMVWLRLIVRGNHHDFAVSHDGKSFRTYGEVVWGDGPPKRIGLVAKGGELPDVAEIEARFDLFECRSLSEAEKNPPHVLERQKLQGVWNVTSYRISGSDVPLRKARLAQLIFDDVHATLAKDDISLKGTYQLDVESKPARLILNLRDDEYQGSLQFVYSLKSNRLTLCSDLLRGDTVFPAEVDSKPGDNRLLMTLERTSNDMRQTRKRGQEPLRWFR